MAAAIRTRGDLSRVIESNAHEHRTRIGETQWHDLPADDEAYRIGNPALPPYVHVVSGNRVYHFNVRNFLESRLAGTTNTSPMFTSESDPLLSLRARRVVNDSCEPIIRGGSSSLAYLTREPLTMIFMRRGNRWQRMSVFTKHFTRTRLQEIEALHAAHNNAAIPDDVDHVPDSDDDFDVVVDRVVGDVVMHEISSDDDEQDAQSSEESSEKDVSDDDESSMSDDLDDDESSMSDNPDDDASSISEDLDDDVVIVDTPPNEVVPAVSTTCTACLLPVEAVGARIEPCGATYCVDCIPNLISSHNFTKSLDDQTPAVKEDLPACACEKCIASADGPSQIPLTRFLNHLCRRANVPGLPEKIDKWHALMKLWRQCPSCNKRMLIDTCAKVYLCTSDGCANASYGYCTKCNLALEEVPHHCKDEDDSAHLRELQDKMDMVVFMEENGIHPCPRCHIGAIKDDPTRCNHVKCGRCNTPFCAACGFEFPVSASGVAQFYTPHACSVDGIYGRNPGVITAEVQRIMSTGGR